MTSLTTETLLMRPILKIGRLIASILTTLSLFLATCFATVVSIPYGLSIPNALLGPSKGAQSIYMAIIFIGLIAWIILFILSVSWALQHRIKRCTVRIGMIIGIASSTALGLIFITIIPIFLTWLYALFLYRTQEIMGLMDDTSFNRDRS
ncbi:hypothetical protein ACFQNF_18175 [Iodobacter arcticus]|uniref:DUF4064 domain-containing protein n=1 Tax=Iodobacter arcticus TaxID=590593 RepID=A0ABW2R3C1_9NEIS